MKTFFLILLCLTLSATFAFAGIPDLTNSFSTCAYEGPGYATVLNVPDGSGAPFFQARLDDGTLVDATITVTLLDGAGFPIANFPREDLWLESLDGGISPCAGGNIADTNTDYNGQAQWRLPMHAGSFSTGGCQVSIIGDLVYGPELPVKFNSPDLNGDGQVDLIDLSLFAEDFYIGYDERSDFQKNGAIDLGDLSRMSSALGVECP